MTENIVEPWDLDAVLIKANQGATEVEKEGYEYGKSACARYSSDAIEAGFSGRKVVRRGKAKFYGQSLRDLGFIESGPFNSSGSFVRGDVAVSDPVKPYRVREDGSLADEGHMCIYDGNKWISDFRQNNPEFPYPGPGYRKAKPNYWIYKYPNIKRKRGQDDSKSSAVTDTLGKEKLDKFLESLKESTTVLKNRDPLISPPLKPGALKPDDKAVIPAPVSNSSVKPQNNVTRVDSASVVPKVPPAPALPPAADSSKEEQKALKDTLNRESRAVEKAEEAQTLQEKNLQEGRSSATQLMEKGYEGAVTAAQDKVFKDIKPLGALVKAEKMRTSAARTLKAARGAFRQGLAFGWPAGPFVGAAAAAVTLVAGRALGAQIAQVKFEEGGPVGGSGESVRKRSSSRQGRSIHPVVNLEIDGEADPIALKGIQEALESEVAHFTRNQELTRMR